MILYEKFRLNYFRNGYQNKLMWSPTWLYHTPGPFIIIQGSIGPKNENLGLWTKINQILYTYSVDSQKTKNAKTNRLKLEVRLKNENLDLWTKLNQM